MTPVCPACRGQLSLDAFRCPRCGLAVRPTCSECGEPLTPGADACWRCSSRIEQGPILTPASIATAVIEAPAYVAVDAPPRTVRRHPVRRFVLWAIVLTIACVVALIAFEVFRPHPAPVDASAMTFGERDVPKEFTVQVPVRWELVLDPTVAAFDDPAQPDGALGMRIVPMTGSLADARKNLATVDEGIISSFQTLQPPAAATVDKRSAFSFVFSGNDTVIDQWFVSRPKGVFRIDVYARGDLADDMHAIAQRIVSTFHVL